MLRINPFYGIGMNVGYYIFHGKGTNVRPETEIT